MEKDLPRLQVREIPDKTGNYEKCWLFLKHQKPYGNYDFRWMIARQNDGWIGVIALFPATHKNAIDKIANEMVLAQQAIREIENNYQRKVEGSKKIIRRILD